MSFRLNGIDISDENIEQIKKLDLNGKSGSTILWIAFIVGIILIAYNAFMLVNKLKKEVTYIQVEAEIVDYNTKRENREDNRGYEYTELVYAPIYEYKVEDTTYTYTSKYYQSEYKSIGTKTLLKYNPQNPKDVIELNTSGGNLLGVIGGIIVIIVTIVLSIVRLFKKNKEVS